MCERFVPDHRSEGLLICTCGLSWGAAVHHRRPRKPLVPPPRQPGQGTPCPLPVGLTPEPY
jgi:hypothetical protein